jgi:dUTP pyrophosphatase
MSNLKIKLKRPELLPHIGSTQAAGLDLRADTKDVLIEAGKEYTFCTGVIAAIPENWVGLLLPRSGLGTKYGMRLVNTCGVIDSDYRGFIKVTCTFDKEFWLTSLERIVQMVVVPHLPLMSMEIVDELDETERGDSGFGSSGRT